MRSSTVVLLGKYLAVLLPSTGAHIGVVAVHPLLPKLLFTLHEQPFQVSGTLPKHISKELCGYAIHSFE